MIYENPDFVPEDDDIIPLTEPPFYLPDFEVAYRYIIDEYEVAPRELAIFIPCAIRKPYSTSPSHRIIRKIISDLLDSSRYHIVIFGTCGILPAELETMYPYAHYRYMLGKVRDPTIQQDFLRIETERVAGYLKKTQYTYKRRIAYCIGLFRRAFIEGSEKSGIPIDLILPSQDIIDTIIKSDGSFPEGSLCMDEYLQEFYQALATIKQSMADDLR
ncbi:MAG: DUF5591 domain-containing protein [Methanospirillaceae archaeon]|nr:DUF5591 domain-containing protein [Methanospirillaceae archaeon]